MAKVTVQATTIHAKAFLGEDFTVIVDVPVTHLRVNAGLSSFQLEFDNETIVHRELSVIFAERGLIPSVTRVVIQRLLITDVELDADETKTVRKFIDDAFRSLLSSANTRLAATSRLLKIPEIHIQLTSEN